MTIIKKKIRVLVIDDMAMVRDILNKGLSGDPEIEVAGTAPDPYIARDKILELRPDVLTLDVEMPKMDGVTFLKKLMPQYPLPVVMVSSLTDEGARTTLDALQAGAVDFVAKPSSDLARGLNAMIMELREKVKEASKANVSKWKNKRRHCRGLQDAAPIAPNFRPDPRQQEKVIVIGASTGGTEAIKEVVTKFPATAPGTVIVQHMPGGFTRMFAERLDQLCKMEVKEAENGDQLRPGRILLAPGGFHMELANAQGKHCVRVRKGALVNGHCPSVEVLMDSAARICGRKAIGVMLTGMGSDGANAMKRMRESGARTMAQDENSCVVFGMPKAAWENGGVEKLHPLENMTAAIFDILRRSE